MIHTIRYTLTVIFGLKINYCLIIRKESKLSSLRRALKEHIEAALTVSGDSEFHTLMTLWEKNVALNQALRFETLISNYALL